MSNEKINSTGGQPSSPSACSVLFIGGAADGARRPDPLRNRVLARSLPAPPKEFVPSEYDHPQVVAHSESSYRRERVRAGDQEWTIYVEARLTIAEALFMLISKYPTQNA